MQGKAGQSVCERSWKLKCRANADTFSNANAAQGATTVVRTNPRLSYMMYPTNPMESISGNDRGRSKEHEQTKAKAKAHASPIIMDAAL